MQFRKDINGLRAIAVIGVVLFHFKLGWVSGGFAGVDVFFVISGFLMTSIIFSKMKKDDFSALDFYIARANRIIPALAFICFVLLVLGFIYLSPLDYSELGKHVFNSMTFMSNITYWRESGYFDTASHGKWLLHTWSLSVEWQFYVIFPLVLILMKKFMSLNSIRIILLLGTFLGFIFCLVMTKIFPDPSYYLLPTRAWEMMFGGLAFLYPIRVEVKNKKYFEWLGLLLIIISYFFFSEDEIWPGYLAFFPVFGTFLIIQANRNDSVITGNCFCQFLGRCSYSIYLWHWPIVVCLYYFELGGFFIYLGVIISLIFGFLSYRYIERVDFRIDTYKPFSILRFMPFWFLLVITMLGYFVYSNNGFLKYSTAKYQELVAESVQSPYRDKCHINKYQKPTKSCEYFGKNITWATFGDSHTVEIAYALAERLKEKDVGLKHFSFSACKPSYEVSDEISKCARWYNDSVRYIVDKESIRNVVFNHRFTTGLLGGSADLYPENISIEQTEEALIMIEKVDNVINLLASKKDKVYVFYPIPELPRPIHKLISKEIRNGSNLNDVLGTDVNWYRNRNSFVINHFNKTNYPENVFFINPEKSFCDTSHCYAVKNGVPLYFDDDHPSVSGARKLVELMDLLD